MNNNSGSFAGLAILTAIIILALHEAGLLGDVTNFLKSLASLIQ